MDTNVESRIPAIRKRRIFFLASMLMGAGAMMAVTFSCNPAINSKTKDGKLYLDFTLDCEHSCPTRREFWSNNCSGFLLASIVDMQRGTLNPEQLAAFQEQRLAQVALCFQYARKKSDVKYSTAESR